MSSVSSARAALLLASLAGLATARIGGDGRAVAREDAKAPYEGQCCLWSSHADWGSNECAPCDEIAPAGSFCAHSKYNCEKKCENAVWCGDGFKPPTGTLAPTPWKAVDEGNCCLWSKHADWGSNSCAPCGEVAPHGSYCAHSKYNCEKKCKDSVWCDKGLTMKPVAKPTTPAPTVEKKTGGGRCCLWSSHADWGADECAPCDEPAKAGTFCDLNRYNCERSCSNAVWCEGSFKTVAPTASKTKAPTPWKAEDEGGCCLWSSHGDWGSNECAPCDDLAKAGTFCAHSKYNCEQKCSNAVWCGDGFKTRPPVPKPVAKPTLKPTMPKPTMKVDEDKGTCCFYSVGGCENCLSAAPAGTFCAESEDKCINECGGKQWCPPTKKSVAP